jgi:hypothetical protein
MAPSTQPWPLPRLSGAVGALFLAGLLLCLTATARADGPSAQHTLQRGGSTPVVVAWGIGKYLSSWSTRSGVIKIALVTMCLGLFILMKKFVDAPDTPWRGRPTTDR